MTKGVDLNRPWCGTVLITQQPADLSALPHGSWIKRMIWKLCRIKRQVCHAILRRLGETWGDPS